MEKIIDIISNYDLLNNVLTGTVFFEVTRMNIPPARHQYVRNWAPPNPLFSTTSYLYDVFVVLLHA